MYMKYNGMAIVQIHVASYVIICIQFVHTTIVATVAIVAAAAATITTTTTTS